MPLRKTTLPRKALETPMESKFRKAIYFQECPWRLTLDQMLTFWDLTMFLQNHNDLLMPLQKRV